MSILLKCVYIHVIIKGLNLLLAKSYKSTCSRSFGEW